MGFKVYSLRISGFKGVIKYTDHVWCGSYKGQLIKCGSYKGALIKRSIDEMESGSYMEFSIGVENGNDYNAARPLRVPYCIHYTTADGQNPALL